MRGTRVQFDLDEGAADGDLHGFVEVAGGVVKTGRTMEQQSMSLPFTAVSQGVAPFSWAKSWEAARAEAGLVSEAGTKKVVQPAPALDGGWLRRPWTTDECVRWMQSVFDAMGVQRSPGQTLGSHSLKATTLSWCGKYGVPKDIRRTLGYHISSEDNSVFVYGRDNLAEPLRWLAQVVAAVRDKTFDPDATRSGRFTASGGIVRPQPEGIREQARAVKAPRVAMAKVQARPKEIVVEEEEDAVVSVAGDEEAKPTTPSSTSSSSGSGTSAGTELVNMAADEELAESVGKRIFLSPADHQGFHLYQHNDSGVLHWASVDVLTKMVGCGKVRGPVYSRVTKPLRFQWPQCMLCARKVGIEISMIEECT
jgi:hypothetical protein